MKEKKYNKKKYNLGSFVQSNGQGLALAGTVGGQLLGDNGAGDFLSGAGSGAATGAALGSIVPGVGNVIGAVAGGLIGGIGSIFGGGKRRKREEEAQRQQMIADNKSYLSTINQGLDTYNENPYGNIFANGGDVFPGTINIEKGELQINPLTGKVLREYNGINPETGGKYEPHSKGKDTKNNLVSAEEGTFIITKALAKDYKDAVDNNDKYHKESILSNIRNAKNKKDSKYKLGSYVKYATGGDLGTGFSDWNKSNQLINASGVNMPSKQGLSLGNGLNTLVGLAPSLLNIGQGLFGKTEVQAPITRNVNPFTPQVLANMPQDINTDSIINELRLGDRAAGNNLRNQTSSSSIYRANRLQQISNLDRNISNVRLQGQQANNQVRGQRASIYNQLGGQDLNEQARVQQTNLGIDQINAQNRAAKSNLLATGLGQLQQTVMNTNMNNKRSAMEEMQMKLMMEMFPNMKFYSGLFNK